MAAPSREHERTERADPSHVAAVVASARTATPPPGGTVVVAVDGRSGSGKTLLATAVAAALDAPVVHLDDVYPGWDGLAEGVALVTADLLGPVSRGEAGTYRRWDWMRSRPGRVVRVPVAPVLVVEGCGALVEPAAAHATVRVWVEAPDEERRRRALARDGETYAPHWDRWAAQEDLAYAARPWEDADLVVRTVAR
ncbi:hypothetical protein ACK8HX_13505 [Oryzobacter sp. R7]|uniref:hypothetical protein n=1 Tax=Oryzobacter faecalis TaxID=3388656 RepID=UPI00398D0CE8